MKTKFLSFFILAALFVAGLFIPGYQAQNPTETIEQLSLPATITEVLSERTESGQAYIQNLAVTLDDSRQRITIENDELFSANRRIFEAGDRVLVNYIPSQDLYYIVDYIRTAPLTALFVIFAIVVLLTAGFQGIGALLGMAFSFLIILKLVLPLILNGTSPVHAAILGAVFIIPLTFYSSHGINRKTTVAVLGTLVTLMVAALLATVFADWGNLTGLASEEASYLKIATAEKINFTGLVLAGMIISILGVLDDITISQASVVQQLKFANKKMSFKELYTRALRVGQDHISSLVNTLILVYAGASLPLLLLFLDHSQSFTNVINLEFMAEEVIRTLVGSISIVLAVPITTLLAAMVSTKGLSKDDIKSHCHH